MQRLEIKINGIVQGVGFRPFVYSLACQLNLTGFIANRSDGVIVQIQGPQQAIEKFTALLSSQAPILSKPQIIYKNKIDIVDAEDSFIIKQSQTAGIRQVVVSADAAICQQCKTELLTASDRRFHYPFINCTNCGPRYTILADIPYDRVNTTMHKFKMCEPCQNEYDNPLNRRYHAQPNACRDCGPELWLCDNKNHKLSTNYPIAKAIELLENNYILAIKGLGGFHLAVRADNDKAIENLRNRKFRKAQAFALMVNDIETGSQLADISISERELLLSPVSPIVLCRKKDNSIISPLIAPHSRFQGLMLPYTPLHVLLMQGDYPALVMTSGNSSGEPIETDNSQVLAKLDTIADYFLMHNRDIFTCCDDSMVKVFDDKPMLLRRSRGFAPVPIALQSKSGKQILAFGADLKNTVSLAKDNQVYISQHIGDVENANAYDNMVQTVQKLQALVGLKPEIIVCDKHPSMMTTRYARQYDLPLIQVQHHHAHVAAVMGEHNLDGPVLALAADGLGFGDDENIWGCEFLLAKRDSFQRLGHLKSIGQPGGDKAAKQPWRMAVSYLLNTYGIPKGKELSRQYLKGVQAADINIVAEMIEKNINCPATSSLGRLFDAISALLGICIENSYQAQAAIELEYFAKDIPDSYQVNIVNKNDLAIIDPSNLIQQVITDLENNTPISIIAGKFHNYIADSSSGILCQLANKHNCSQIILAGGVFQNDILLTKTIDKLRNQKFQVYYNQKLPVNDGAISFGQIVVADAILTNTR
ncbi:MAG: carbamoyltransferase HypF [Phycisphaerae bacterium]|nr:carbamoyltransferase HypF [Phycisphaerae bacterium]